VIMLADAARLPVSILETVFDEASIVLLVSVSVVSLATKVLVPVGKVTVPEFDIVEIVGLVSVLFVRVSVVARPTIVSVDVGRVRVFPEFVRVGLFMVGEVRVLLVRVSVVPLPTRVSVEVGRVIVPVLLIEEITGDVKVLFVNVLVFVVVTISADPERFEVSMFDIVFEDAEITFPVKV
jgi:hypothetical protein